MVGSRLAINPIMPPATTHRIIPSTLSLSLLNVLIKKHATAKIQNNKPPEINLNRVSLEPELVLKTLPNGSYS